MDEKTTSLRQILGSFGRRTPAYVPEEDPLDPLRSQKGQVRWLLMSAFNYRENGLKWNGYFVDLAAGHPVHLSNTYFLERFLNWRGLLIEANPGFADELRAGRSSTVVQEVVGSTEGELVQFRIDNGELGGIVGEKYDNSFAARGRELEKAIILELRTKTLSALLREEGAPRKMDFLSLDVEGAELDVLKGVDFEQFSWRAICVERPSLETCLILDQHGYIQVAHEAFDIFFVHKNHIASANLNKSSARFLITPRKNW